MTNTNNGKITWKLLKPIIQGKILFGPESDETSEIVSFANKTFNDMSRLREFIGSLETSVKMLKTDKEFRSNFDNLLNLAKSPFVQAILGGSIDIQTIELVLDSIVNDTQVADVIGTIGNIFDCFSVDRFVPVKDEKELEDVAHDLAKKKLFYAGVFFNGDVSSNETSYKLRMEVDNTPVTIENRNRFWFPGAEGNFELEMRYHRGFIQIQSSVDNAIIKYHKNKQFGVSSTTEASEDLDFSDLDIEDDVTEKSKKSSEETFTNDDDDDDFSGLALDNNGDFGDQTKLTTAAPTTSTPSNVNFEEIFKTLQGNVNISEQDVDKFSDDSDFWDFDDEDFVTSGPPPTTEAVTEPTTTQPSNSRKKRQLESLLSMLGFGGGSEKLKAKEVKFEVDDMSFYTKQFPYPKHTRDDFKKGL